MDNLLLCNKALEIIFITFWFTMLFLVRKEVICLPSSPSLQLIMVKLVVLPDDCCNIAALPLSLSGIIFIVVFPVFIVIVEFVFIFALLFKIVTDIRVTFQDASPYPSSQAHKRFSACRDLSPFCLSLSALTGG